MNSKTQKNLRRAKTHQKIDALQGNVTGVSPDPKLTREEGAQVTEAIMPRKTLEAEITDPLELGKVPKEDQEKFRLLLNYIHDLLGIIRRLEDQLQRSSNVGIVGKTMVAGLAHDLRNPMAVIGSCAQFCLENEKLTPVTEQYLQMIMENGRAAINLLNQFLEFAKVNLTFKSLNLNEIVKKTWQAATLETGCRNVTFNALLVEDLPEIFADPEKIERTFLNLFLNAIQAVSQNCSPGMVAIQTRFLHSENMAEIDITDNGPGIPEEIQNKIYEPFFTTKKGGTGLGLHLCQYFIDQHKGKITIGKAGKGGTKVTVRLPITQEKEDNILLKYSDSEQFGLAERSHSKFLNES